MSKRTRPDRCGLKTAFSSVGSAEAFMRRRLLKQVAYRCNNCGSYHLTKAKVSALQQKDMNK